MDDLPEFYTSASYLTGIVRALTKLDRLQAVIERSTPPTVAMLKTPNAQAWWGRVDSIAVTVAMTEVGGAELVRQVGRLAVFESMSPILRPLVGVLTAIAGPSPGTLFGRFSQLTSAAVKNVRFEWQEKSRTSGTLTIEYPVTLPESYLAYWEGAIEFVYETTKRKGGPTHSRRDGGRLQFELSWT